MGRRRAVVYAALLGCAALALAVGLWHLDAALDRRWGERGADGPGAGDHAPADILRAWDERRARAYLREDPEALRELYAAGSVSGDRDVAALRRYRARGIRVTGMRTQLLAVKVREDAEHRLELLVTDRLASAAAAVGGREVPLPTDRPSTYRVTLVRDGGRWLVLEVVASDQAERPRPADKTSRTSVSANS